VGDGGPAPQLRGAAQAGGAHLGQLHRRQDAAAEKVVEDIAHQHLIGGGGAEAGAGENVGHGAGVKAADGIAPLLIRSYAYLYGIPVVLCAGCTAFFADINGVIASSNQEVAAFETSPKNCYRVVTSRRRGLFCDGYEDY